MILIQNGILLDPASDREGEYDLLIGAHCIEDVQPRGVIAAQAASKVIDAAGKWILPGLIDMHVHLREPGYEWKETVRHGSRAAVAGGYTSICCMPNTDAINDSAEVTKYILEKAQAAACARVMPIGAVSVGSHGKLMTPYSEMRHAGCVAFSDDGQPVYDSGLMRRALEWCSMLDVPICCHEEDKCLSCGGSMNESALSFRMGLRGMPSVAEDVVVARDIELARYTGGRVHFCHVSTARSVELIRRAKNDHIRVTAEVTPHHLVLTESAVEGYNTYAKMSPPLRSEEDVAALRAGLKDGTLDVVASDHSPHEDDAKIVEFERAAFGLVGLQTSLPLLLEFVQQREISRMRLAEALAFGPARILGLKLGSLAKGAPADICIIDPVKRWVFERGLINSKSWNSPFLGRSMTGIAQTVLVDGRIVVEGEELKVAQ
jgi:dihydroorotase